MAITSVNLPAHLYSHTEVKVTDNDIAKVIELWKG